MTETLTSPSLSDLLKPVPADWGVFDCARLATAAEFAEAGGKCFDCGEKIADKYGPISGVTGTVLGFRFSPTDLWVWYGPLCRSCDIAHSIADGYGKD